MQLATCCGCGNPIGEGIGIAILLAPFVPFVARSRHSAKILAAIGVFFMLEMLETMIGILSWFEDDLRSIVAVTGLVIVVAVAGRLIRGPDRLARLGTIS